MTTYTLNADGTSAIRSSDSAFVPWDAANDRPLDFGGYVGQIWVNDGSPASIAYVAPAPTIPETISQRQFMEQLAIEGDITWAECIAYLGTGAIPQIFLNAINEIPTTTDANAQNKAQTAFVGATSFDRHNMLTIVLGELIGKTSSQLDAIWTAASLIT